jgi:pilus assembly protein Flp/PilA
MTNSVRRFIEDESGATAIEYGLIAAGIAVAIIVAVNAVGTDLNSLFGRISAKLNAAGN